MQDMQSEPTGTTGSWSWSSRGRQVVAGVIGAALTLVIVAPIALSSSDLVKWAQDPQGLGLDAGWAWLVFVALDAAAATCVGMVILSAWRGESGGAFHYLTWVFAGFSAIANYRHGTSTPARDDQYFFPAMSLLGPLLLEVVLHRVRRWVKEDKREQMSARAKFGRRWLPGVAFTETLRAWAVSQREGISQPAVAIALVRERTALAELEPGERVAFAWDALGPDADVYEVRSWLLARSVQVDRAALAAGRPAQITATVSDLNDVNDLTDPDESEQTAIVGTPAEDAAPVAKATAAATSKPSTGVRVSATRKPRDAGAKVRALRDKHPDWTVEQIAARAGVTDRTVRRHLNAPADDQAA